MKLSNVTILVHLREAVGPVAGRGALMAGILPRGGGGGGAAILKGKKSELSELMFGKTIVALKGWNKLSNVFGNTMGTLTAHSSDINRNDT